MDMASQSTEGPRQRTTESTSITSTTSPPKDYSSISRVPSRDAAQKLSSSNMNGSATQEGTSDRIERGASQQRADSARRRAKETERRESGWWSEFWEKWGSVELENKGSVARDHLALGMSPLRLAHLHFDNHTTPNWLKKRMSSLTPR